MENVHGSITIDEIVQLYERLKINTSSLPKYDSFEEYCVYLSNEHTLTPVLQLMSKTEAL